jgi:hypothetical protein
VNTTIDHSVPRELRKYPRTQHLEGSRLQPGDEDLDAVPFSTLAGRPLVVEEKVDGANVGFSFDAQGRLWLQSRGHYLRGGVRERHFALFKQWAHAHVAALWDVLQDRYVVYGEWLYAKHTVFYDRLPHYFLEFDVLDLVRNKYLSTAARRALLSGLPLHPVPVLHTGTAGSMGHLTAHLGPSRYRSAAWRDALVRVCGGIPVDATQVLRETDPTELMEGLYVKVEEADCVVARYKFVRASFLTTVVDSGSHWLDRPVVPNQLAPGVELFG